MDSASKAIVNLIASSVASLTNEIIKVSDTISAPQVGSSNAWFTASYKRTMGVSLYLMAIVSLIAITAAGIRGKVGDMAQVIFVGIPGSVVAMMLATLGVQLALALTDAMTAYTFGSSVDDIQTFLHDIGVVFTATDGAAQPTAALAPGLVLIIGLLMIVAQLVILAVLIVRAALIYIVTLFLPLVFAMQVWPATRHMTRKALELLAVLILSKFAIFTCFALGAGALHDLATGTTAASGGAPAVQTAIVGFGVMLTAAFSPMMLISIIPGIAGTFGSGEPGGAYGAGVLAIKSPTQIMRSTLASVHTVRGASSNHTASNRNTGRSTSNTSTTPRPPGGTNGAAGTRTGNGGASGGGSAAMEQAHSTANAHPAAATAATSAQTLAAGATTAASTTHATPSPTASGTSSSTEGPHVISSRPDERTAPASTPTSRDAGESATRQLALPVGDESERSVDGFSRVRTRQPFTLETT
jgi:hypothetical protein